MKKKVILLLIILIPSLIYFLFELSEVNFKKMAYYGPKTVDTKGDTIYYSIPPELIKFVEVTLEKRSDTNNVSIFTSFLGQSPVQPGKAFVAILLKPGTEKKLSGLLEYQKYKENKFKDLSVVFIKPYYPTYDPDTNKATYKVNISQKYLEDSLGIYTPEFHIAHITGFMDVQGVQFNYVKYLDTYFPQKPSHVFDYFAVLIDKDRHIRGYYDPTYISEVKRMVEEYKHLMLKDEHAEMQKNNEIKKK